MDKKEFYEHPNKERSNQEYSQKDDPYEAEETLSLCDLPTYGDSSDSWDILSSDQYESCSSSSSEDQDLFEFSSQEQLSFSSHHQSADNIVFCGKLIPYKQPVVSQKPQNCDSQGSVKKRKNSSKGSSKVAPIKKLSYAGGSFSPGKSKWYRFMFGLTQFPAEMQLSDIKNRQSRRNNTNTSRARACDDGGEVIITKDGRSRGKKGLWGLLRSLGCSGADTNAMVKASFGCVPQV